MKEYENKFVIPPSFIAVTFWIIIFTGCSTVLSTFSEEIVLGHFSDVKNGRLLIPVELEKKINSWYVIFGKREIPNKLKKINDSIVNQRLTVSIINKTNVKVAFRGNRVPVVEILPDKEEVWYSGTLSNLLFKTGAIKTSLYFADQPCKYDIKLEFEDKSIKFDTPIIIHAYRSWY